MRKKIVTGMLAVSLVFMMTGCCLSHDWQEATCTEPKTCSKCGETEGDVSGHTWEEATCTAPKTCSVCGETEGEALGHTLSEATYWEAAVCSVCGETVAVTEENLIRLLSGQLGLTDSFENLTEVFMAAYENAGIDLDARITAQATVTDYQVFDSDETHEGKEGYEWKTVEMQIEYDTPDEGENVFYYGYDNYYIKDEEGDQGDSEYEPGWDNEAALTVNWKGQDYTECRAISADVSNTGWVEDAEGNFSLTYTAKFDFLYPKGYDGGLLYLSDYKNSGVRPVNFANTDENTLFFRLQ